MMKMKETRTPHINFVVRSFDENSTSSKVVGEHLPGRRIRGTIVPLAILINRDSARRERMQGVAVNGHVRIRSERRDMRCR